MNCKLFSLIIFTFFISKIGFSQNRNQEKSNVQVLTLPDSYYKGIEEKRKYAAQHNKSQGIITMTATTSYPEVAKNTKMEEAPDLRAKNMLNTTVVPADFPVYKTGMTNREYETLVAQWFKINPSYRKKNN